MDAQATTRTDGIQPARVPLERRDALRLTSGVDPLALATCLEAATARPGVRSDHQLHRLAAIASLELATKLTEGPQPTIKRIVQVTHPLLRDCGGISVILFDRRQQGFVTSASTVPGQEDGVAATRVRRSRGATRFIVESGHGLYVRDTHDDPFTANRMLEDTGNRCYVGLPIHAGGEVLGVLYAMGHEPGQYDAEDVELLALVADRAAVVIQAASEHERVRRLATQQAVVARASARLAASEHPGLVVREVLDMVAPALDLDALAFLPASPHAALPVSVVARGPVGWATATDHQDVARALLEPLADGRAVLESVDVGQGHPALLVAVRDDDVLSDVDRVTLGQVTVLVGTTIRRALAMEDLRASNESLAQFAHVVSHDLRSPLASVGGLLEVVLLTEDALSPEGRECAERAVDVTRRMSETMQALLDSAGGRVGGVDRSSVDVGEIVRQVLDDLQDPIAVAGATVDVERDLPQAFADAAGLRVVVQNLVANAVKFCRPGVPPVIRIGASGDDEDGLTLVVADEGCGVTDADRERVFGMFDRGSSPALSGSGIGLSTVRRIVEAHGGRVWIEPNRPHGTVAVVKLPGTPVWLETTA